jgi:hypothetical protein
MNLFRNVFSQKFQDELFDALVEIFANYGHAH